MFPLAAPSIISTMVRPGFSGSRFDSPGSREFFAHLGIGYRLVGGEDIRQAAHVASALDVVLPAQRIYASRFDADISAQHRQIGYAFYRVGSVYVLGYSHGIGNGSGGGLRVEAGGAHQKVFAGIPVICRTFSGV